MTNWTNSSGCLFNLSLYDAEVVGNETMGHLEYPTHLFPVYLLHVITVTCAFLFLVGVTGNLMTILVVTKYRDMRTTTNLYLSSMAFSDLLIFVCMPLDLYRIWRYRPWNFGDLLCKLFQFVSECCTYSTILHITALCVERYFAICFPLKAKVVETRERVKGVIALLWLVAGSSAGPVFVLVGVSHVNGTDPRETNECTHTEYAIHSGLLTVMVWVSGVFYFLPVLCLTVLYSLIGRRLWRRKKHPYAQNVSNRDKSNKQTVKMLVVVVMAFVLCWLPFHVERYLSSRTPESTSPLINQIKEYCRCVSLVLFYLSAAINPILYNIMSEKYRMAACKLFGLKHASTDPTTSTVANLEPGCGDSGQHLEPKSRRHMSNATQVGLSLGGRQAFTGLYTHTPKSS